MDYVIDQPVLQPLPQEPKKVDAEGYYFTGRIEMEAAERAVADPTGEGRRLVNRLMWELWDLLLTDLDSGRMAQGIAEIKARRFGPGVTNGS